MATITIDRKKIEAGEDTTILEAARGAGLHIPTLCYHAKLSPIGSCRVCLVEIDGVSSPVTSCNTNVRDGMVIRTDSQRLRRMRRSMVELLLVDHPLDCPVCDKAGECELQDIVFELGLSDAQYEPVGAEREINEVNKFIGRYPSRCIMCGRCVRACEEIQGAGVMNYVSREGYRGEVAVVARDTVECEQCGQCLSVCPVGALIDQSFKYRARSWELASTETTCPYCAVGCSIKVNVKDGRIARVRAGDGGPSDGNLCVRGHFGVDFVDSPDRLTKPLIRSGGELREADWEEALELVAQRLDSVRRTNGGEALAVFGSARCTTESNYLLQKFARLALGTNNIDFSERLLHAGALEGIAEVFGTHTAASNSLAALEWVSAVLVVGTDASETQPTLTIPIQRAVRRHGAKLVVIDSRRTRLARQATQWLAAKPGTEQMVLAALVRSALQRPPAELVERGQLAALLDALSSYDFASVAEISGVSVEELEMAARALSAGSIGVLISALATRETARLASDLVLLSDDPAGGGIYAIGLSNNWQGAFDAGVTASRLPGGSEVADEQARSRFEEAWDASLPPTPGLSAPRFVEAAREGRIKAAYIMGDSLSRLHGAVEALDDLDFVVAQHALSGPVVEHADVILPATSFAEQRGTFTNMEGLVQRVRPALRPRGEARNDRAIIADVALRLGITLEAGAEEIMQEMSSLCPAYAGCTYELLEGGGVSTREAKKAGEGFPHLVAAAPMVEEDAGAEDFPFALTVDQRRFHSGTLSGYSRRLSEVYPEPMLEINPEDADRLGLKPSLPVVLRTAHGEARLKVKITSKSLPGTLFLPLAFVQSDAANLLGSNGKGIVLSGRAAVERLEAEV